MIQIPIEVFLLQMDFWVRETPKEELMSKCFAQKRQKRGKQLVTSRDELNTSESLRKL